MEFKLEKLRDSMINLGQFQGLENLKELDSKYIFYYDETNNIRKLLLKEDKYFNIGVENIYKNFVLGGLCLKNEISNESIEELLKNNLKLQPTIKEIKLIHIAKGDFLQCLNSQKLSFFLNWILSNDIYFHYSSLNLLFWSIVDIVDSCMEIDDKVAIFNFDLKTILYELVKQNLEEFATLFIEFQYPNLKIEQASLFLEKLICIIEQRKSQLIVYGTEEKIKEYLIEMLISILLKAKNQELVFIMNEKDCSLIDNLFEFYLRPIYTFVNAKHIFDEEINIKEMFKKYTFTYRNEKIYYKFLDSRDSKLIQFSDIIIGLVGKMYEYINKNNIEQISRGLSNLNAIQEKNIKLLKRLIDKSDMKCKAFIHSIEALTEKQKIIFLLESIK